MAKLTGSLVKYPARVSFIWYLATIVLGALLLTHPAARAVGRAPITALEALFTSTSAVCVTGLTVRSTGNDFSLLGQAIILLLIQLGGIGIITVTTFITFRLGSAESLRQRAAVGETLGAEVVPDLAGLLRGVFLFTALVEGLGFLLLAARAMMDQPPAAALWWALFHSVSAFCNAGFGLSDDSLVRYQGDLLVNLTIIGLIVVGGIGFPVTLDIRRNWRHPWSQLWDNLHVHSKLMVLGTAVLLLAGTVMFLVLEWRNTLADMPLGQRLLVSLFQAVTPRTAGFNTVPIGSLASATLFTLVLLMFIGGGPCSTAGGLKVSTLLVVLLRAWSTFRGHTRVNLFRRTIPAETIARATSTSLVFGGVVILGVMSLLLLEQPGATHAHSQGAFLSLLFEFVSALCTVGLSTGITAQLATASQVALILAMFIGRLGPISVFVVFSRVERPTKIAFPSERPLIG